MHHPAAPEDSPSPPPGIVHADLFVQPYGYFARRSNGTRDWLLTFTQSGTGKYRTAAEANAPAFDCCMGDVVILQPGAYHDYGTAAEDAPWNFYWAHFTPRNHWLGWLRLPEVAPNIHRQHIANAAARERIQTAFVRLVGDRRSHELSHWREELAANALEEILIVMAQQRARDAERVLDERVEATLRYLHEHYAQPIVVSEMAQRVGLSPSRLAHVFKEQVGSSLIETALRLRLKQAANLLEFSALTIQQIAEQVGFESAFYLSRQFKVRYGVSPSGYRQRAQMG